MAHIKRIEKLRVLVAADVRPNSARNDSVEDDDDLRAAFAPFGSPLL